MKNRITFSIFTAALFLFVVSTSPAQESLRNAIDYDGDGKADLGIYRPIESTLYLLKSNGNAFSAQPWGVVHTDMFTPGDYDGDRTGDIAVWRYTDATWYVLNSSTGSFTAVRFGLVGDEPVQRDYDGDGRTDPAVVRRAAGPNGAATWWVLRSETGSASAFQWGYNSDALAPGDYDGDDKFDHAVMRPGATAGAQSFFYIARSSDGGFTVIPWGVKGDWVVPGDYDGDGRTDAAVARRGPTPADNVVWYIRRSSDDVWVNQYFGVTETDTPVQNDYDGDGMTDIAMWRETPDAFYYILSSKTGALSVQNFGYATDMPVAAFDTH